MTHNSSWEKTLSFDFNKEETCQLLSASALYYLDELHVDGIHFNAIRPILRNGFGTFRPDLIERKTVER
jgi:1,4-alpha-glucan branching enzyme